MRDGFSWSAAHAPAIGDPEIGRRPGEIRTFRFRCRRSFKRGGFHILEAEGAEFDAVIPFEVLSLSPVRSISPDERSRRRVSSSSTRGAPRS